MVAAGNNAASYVARFVLSSTELECKQLLCAVGDAATKAIEDTYFIVETFGHASAMYPKDIATDNTTSELNAIADAVLKRDWTAITGEPPRRSLWMALRKVMNKWTVSANVLTVYREDDTTSAYTEATTSAAGNPVTGSDPVG
jgi:hypothetical protein